MFWLANLPACCIASAVLASAATGADAPGDAGAAESPPVGDWYCVGFDASHSYTSPDTVVTPLKFHWAWQPPENEGAELLHAVSSAGTLFVHGLHTNSTPLGARKGCHNWVVDLETGAGKGEDPSGTTANDLTDGHPVGSCGGVIYQCDDGGPPLGGGDVWSPIQVSPTQGWWAIVQQRKIDGPDPGIYCMPIGQGIGSGWHAGTSAPGNPNRHVFCIGNVAIGAGVLYATTQWMEVTGPDLVNGLACYELATGKRLWKLEGRFQAVSPGRDWCVAVDSRNALVVLSAADGTVLAATSVDAMPACPLLVTGTTIGLYDERGLFTRYALTSKNGTSSLKPSGHIDMGRFAGPSVAGPYNCPFCYSQDGTLFIANGSSVVGLPATKKGRTWTWTETAEMAHAIGPLGHPILVHGKLIVVGKGGVLCFDPHGAPEAAPHKPKP